MLQEELQCYNIRHFLRRENNQLGKSLSKEKLRKQFQRIKEEMNKKILHE